MIVLRRKSSGMTVGMLGQVEAGAIIERPDGTAIWLFYLPTRGPLNELDAERKWQRASSVEAARVNIEQAANEWLRHAGVLGELAGGARDEAPLDSDAFLRFHNGLRILHSIDADEFRAVAADCDEGASMRHPRALADFLADPVRWFLKSDDISAAAIWSIIDRRQPSALRAKTCAEAA